MHGRVQLEGWSCRSLRKTSSQHMRPALPLVTTENSIAFQGENHSSPASVTTAASDSFFKDGRKISVGDCALFKPPQDSPPFIGLIRWFATSKDNILVLGVNWLYRPAEIKLGKGTVVEGAPNEIFYSFHKDQISAASLLHPCKVAFLPRGVELPTGTSSFVCRRVYDIANKCLWWLTDQDYVNERQEEVDQLLHKTREEMHATLHSDGRSPRQVNGPTSTSQLKTASDSGQNSGSSSHSQVKGKKRERGDHGADTVKRERSLRSDDVDSFQCKIDYNLKSEISRITDKGGLTELEGVEKLVQLMHPDKSEKKLDLISRSILAGVVAATDNTDCLNWFVQLKGLPVLDEWLQDIHKGKIGNNNGLKESDKSVEEFLLVLLRALDKLPVNLQALQMCNIGRSVNHLRSNKNLDIQKKARGLVDTWKKRVEAEMISIDAKAASSHGTSVWSSKSRLPDGSHGGSRTPSASDVALKSSLTQYSASKTTSARSPHGETNTKSATSSPGHVKSASSPSSGKETPQRVSAGGTPDVPLIREDRSSSSNQSHIYTQSLPVKEDGKSTVSVPMGVNKSSSSTRNRKISSLPGASVTGSPKEISSSRSSSAHKCTALEKQSQSFSSEKVHEGAVTEGNGHKLIVKIPNRVHSPAGGSLEDSTYMSSRVSSPLLLPDKQEQFDRNSEDKSDTYHCNVGSDINVDSWRNDDLKDVLTGSAEGATSPAARPDEEQSMTTEDSLRLSEATPPTNQLRPGKWHVTSFSPMNALIESCVKYSEANTLSMEDDVGMKLLASVATGEISRSDLVSPSDSTEPSTPAVQEVGCGDEAKSKSSPENNIVSVQVQTSGDAQTSDQKQTVLDGGSQSDDVLHSPKHGPPGFFDDRKCDSHISVEFSIGENNKNFNPSNMDAGGKADIQCGNGDKSNKKSSTSSGLPTDADKMRDGDSDEGIEGAKRTSSFVGIDGVANCKSGGSDVMATEEKVITDPLDGDKLIRQDVASDHSSHAKQKNDSNGLDTSSGRKCASEFAEQANSEKLQQSASGQRLVSGICNQDSSEEPNENDAMKCLEKSAKLKPEMEVDGNTTGEVHALDGYSANKLKSHQEASVEEKVTQEHVSVQRIGPSEPELHKDDMKATKYASNQPNEVDGHASTCTGASSVAADANAKMKFDLNGIVSDEGKYGEPVNLMSSALATVHMVNSVPFSANSTPGCHSASITVAAAAKGPFVPPQDLLRGKGELGWKGSAATSAFRPAEPRKPLEAKFGSSMPYPDASTSKPSRMPLEFDLNVPDERVLEEMAPQLSALIVDSKTDFRSARATLPNERLGSMPVRCSSGGLDLDLNRVDEACDIGNCSTSSNYKVEGSIVNVKTIGGMHSSDVRRDFDLNFGPGVDDTCAEPSSINQQVKGVVPSQLPSAGLRMNTAGQGSFSSWFPAGNTYSTIAVPSMLPDRGEHQISVFPPTALQRTFGSSEVTAFTPDVYGGSVLPSSPAVPFPSSSFPYSVFPFGTTFPLPSATFSVGAASYAESSSGPRLFAPPVHSQLLGPVGSISSQFQRPYMVNLPESSSQGFENSRKWSRQGLDLNAGPGAVEGEAREAMFSLSSGQHSVASSQALAEEQARMYSVTSGLMKRKEPDGGWENGSFRYKQSSWQ